MSNPMIANQIQSEIARLERELEELEGRKKRLKIRIRNHRKALKLVNPDASDRAPSASAGDSVAGTRELNP